jgi:hypothetical protein
MKFRINVRKLTACPRFPCSTAEVIDVDSIILATYMPVERPGTKAASRVHCGGNLIAFAPGKNQHTSYPFGLHNERLIPWNYHSIDDNFYLQSKTCTKAMVEPGKVCAPCQALLSTTIYQGVIDRMQHGVHESTPLAYHGVGGLVTVIQRKSHQVQQLRFTKLNNSRKLLGKVAALEDHKQWIMAVASGKVDRVASLVQAGLAHHAGIRSLIKEYDRAAQKLYKPKGYTEEDIMRSIVLLRLGGARVAEFAHLSLSLPSLTTIRRNTVIRPLVVSPSTPLVSEIEANILTCLEAFQVSESSHLATKRISHQIVMLDELATERRPRWDDLTDKFQGTCREHNTKIPLTFSSQKELDILCQALETGDVHLACEVSNDFHPLSLQSELDVIHFY